MNHELRRFAFDAIEMIDDPEGTRYILGIQSPEQADLVDPEYYEFPGDPPAGDDGIGNDGGQQR
jgi:hypothetical protein